MENAYKLALLVSYLVLPGVVLARGNASRSGRPSFARGVAAMVIAWLWLVAIRVVVTSADMWLAGSAAERQAIADGDGAKNATVLLLGWLPSTLLVLLSWALLRLWQAATRARDSARRTHE